MRIDGYVLLNSSPDGNRRPHLTNYRFVIGQFCDGRLVPAERAPGIACDGDFPEPHASGINIQHPIGQGVADA
jgi:hypothetical protein